MQCAGGTHGDWAFRVGGVVAVAVLLWWPASAYGSAGSAPQPSGTTTPAALHTDGPTAAWPLPTDLHLAFSHLAVGRRAATVAAVIPTGAWAWALRCVGYSNARSVNCSHPREQMAVHAAPTLHRSR